MYNIDGTKNWDNRIVVVDYYLKNEYRPPTYKCRVAIIDIITKKVTDFGYRDGKIK